MSIKISSKTVTIWLLGIALALNVIGFIGRAIEYFLGIKETTEIVRLFHVAEEGNITSWFSALLFFLCALLLAFIAKTKKGMAQPYLRHWNFLTLIFIFFSVDEAARIHELTIKPLQSVFNLSGIFHYAWVIVAIPFLVLFVISYLKFLLDLPKTTRNLFIISGALYVAGALGFEMIGGYYLSRSVGGIDITPIIITVEELLENLGLVLFIYTLLTYLKTITQSNQVTLAFD